MSSADSAVVTPSISKAVVPAAGLGTRLRPLTNILPKELLPLGRQPVLAYIMAELREAGVTQVLFVVSERKPQIRDYFGAIYTGEDSSLPPLRCDYAVQQEQRGSGDALLCAQEWVGDRPFVVAFGDCVIESEAPGAPLRRLIAAHHQFAASASILVEAVERSRVSRYGVVAPAQAIGAVPTEPFAISDIVEKPSAAEAPSNLVAAARWILEPSIFVALRSSGPDARGEWSTPDAIRTLLQAGERGCAVPLLTGEARRDIGSMESFLVEFVRAALRDPDHGAATRRVARELTVEEA